MTNCNALKLTLQKRILIPELWALELQNFDYTIQHRPSDRVNHVDVLSRAFSICIVEDNPFEYNLSICQPQNEKIKELCKQLEKVESLLFEMRSRILYRKKNNLSFYVPVKQNMEKNILFRYHNQMSHFELDKTTDTILKNYWFPNLKSKVKTHISNCLKCLSY